MQLLQLAWFTSASVENKLHKSVNLWLDVGKPKQNVLCAKYSQGFICQHYYPLQGRPVIICTEGDQVAERQAFRLLTKNTDCSSTVVAFVSNCSPQRIWCKFTKYWLVNCWAGSNLHYSLFWGKTNNCWMRVRGQTPRTVRWSRMLVQEPALQVKGYYFS